jgi:hypothetical protein
MIQRALSEVHLVLGLGLLALVAAIVVVAAPAALRGRAPLPIYPLLHQAAAMLIVIQLALGILLFAGGRRPRDNLHLVYAAAAILVMPVARSMVRRDQAKARLYQLGGTVLLLGVVFRLATTG